ncbi:hypothetical protein LGM54_06185 [Burkholderia cenocepacia]|uniref:hypothetical protein n=1 Tax=Burkholderia cenocepacia TaxID=95486 RepID=UPI001CF4CD76|nr:hypothetical protein [Burkholderia cenocepacia]MCA7962541.1 hypothetical protein [Burkholderia cenocepacia]
MSKTLTAAQIEAAKEAGFYWHPVRKGLVVRHSSGAWVSVDDMLARFIELLATQQPEPRDEVTGWQPIETAPKDGTPLVMFARYIHATASIVLVASWLEDYGMWVNQSFSCAPIQQVVPSHWMPRPAFPNGEQS